MNIQENSLVTISYLILDQNGDVFEEGKGDDATDFIQGHGELPSGVEDALEGKTVGDKIDLKLDMETGFGPVDPELIIGVPLAELGEDVELSKGDILPVEIATDEGEVTGEVDMTVVEVRADTVFLDANHPLAGQNVSFAAEVLSVREATEEELADLQAEMEHVHDENCNH